MTDDINKLLERKQKNAIMADINGHQGHGRPQGGGGARGGTCPPLEIKKYGGPPKDNLTRKFKKKKILKIKRRNWTEGPPFSKRRN